MTCTNPNCQQVVDPYIEREWLLVAIDCILLRPAAYRHVLWNAKQEFPLLETVTLGRAAQWTIASSILYAYLQYEEAKTGTDATTRTTESRDDVLMTRFPMILFVLTSVFDILVRWATVYSFVKWASSTTTSKADDGLSTKLFWSLLLPTAFHVTSIFVLIWENSKTTRALGSLLVAGWQSVAVSLVAEGFAPNHGKQAAAVGVVAGILWRFLIAPFFPIPCVGFEVDAFFRHRHQATNNDEWLPLLCLT